LFAACWCLVSGRLLLPLLLLLLLLLLLRNSGQSTSRELDWPRSTGLPHLLLAVLVGDKRQPPLPSLATSPFQFILHNRVALKPFLFLFFFNSKLSNVLLSATETLKPFHPLPILETNTRHTMAGEQSALPTLLKPEGHDNGFEKRHHGKTRSHMVSEIEVLLRFLQAFELLLHRLNLFAFLRLRCSTPTACAELRLCLPHGLPMALYCRQAVKHIQKLLYGRVMRLYPIDNYSLQLQVAYLHSE